MNYQAVYDRLIARAKCRTVEEYTERHHIVPRCLGGSDKRSNIVRLRPEEHFLAHKLLALIHPANRGLLHAVVLMSRSKEGSKRSNNKLYGVWRKKFAKSMSSMRSGTTLSEETKRKISAGGKGKKRSPETCAKLSAVNMGKKMSPEVLAKIQESKKGKTPNISKEGLERMIAASRSKKGKPLSEERKAIIAETNRKRCTGVKQTPEHIAKCVAARTGHVVSEETRRKISMANKGTNNRLGTHHKESTKAKMSESAQRRSAAKKAKIAALLATFEDIGWCENE